MTKLTSLNVLIDVYPERYSSAVDSKEHVASHGPWRPIRFTAFQGRGRISWSEAILSHLAIVSSNDRKK